MAEVLHEGCRRMLFVLRRMRRYGDESLDGRCAAEWVKGNVEGEDCSLLGKKKRGE